MLELNRNYTVNELKDIFGEDWLKKANIMSYKIEITKPIINSFGEFNKETGNIYLSIKELIRDKNKNTEIKVWATGSRVKGTWRTKEESEELFKNKKYILKYSDYDFCTDANVIPIKEEFLNKLGVVVDYAGCKDHKVLIE